MTDSAKQTQPAELTAALRALAETHRLILSTLENGAHCFSTRSGNLCVLAVPNRWEIEIWLDGGRAFQGRLFYLSVIESALGKEPSGVLYNADNIGAVVRRLSNVLDEILPLLEKDSSVFLSKIDNAYDEMVRNYDLERESTNADRLWADGNYKEAAEVYATMRNLSAVQAKRLEIARSGKVPKSS